MSDHALTDYSLWLIPEDTETWSQYIEDLKTKEPDSPRFAPHITLYHPVPLSTEPEDIAARLREFKPAELTLRVKGSEAGSTYYQCVLAAIESYPALLQLREECENTWGKIEKPFYPHLSLLYGDLGRDRREELAGSVRGLPASVQIREIAVVRCVGTAEDWTVEASVPI